MIKKIIAIITCIFILSIFMLSTYAHEYSATETIGLFPMVKGPEYSVGPTADFTSRYKMVVDPNFSNNQLRGYTDYNIYDIYQSGIGVVPEEYLNRIGLIQHFAPDYTDAYLSNSISIMLADGTYLSLTVENNNIYGIFTLYNNQGTLLRYGMLFDSISQDNDVALYMNYDAILNIMVYNKTNGNVVSNNTLNFQMYGIVYPSNVYPFAQPTDIENALQTGYENGKRDGIIIGSTIKQEEKDREYQRGYDFGNDVGYQEGFRVGRTESSDGSYQQGYNDGIVQGQNMVEGLDSMYSDFFTGILQFLSPFMNMGIGSLTVYSLITIGLMTFVVIVIIKIIRG